MKAFTLLDAVLGLTLLSVGLIGVLYMFQGSLSSSVLSLQTSIAVNLARETMEKIEAQRDCNLSGCGYSSTLASIAANSYNENPVSGFTGYQVTASALEVNPDSDGGTDDFLDAQSGSGYARVTVSVNWTTAGVANSVSFVTLLASYTP